MKVLEIHGRYGKWNFGLGVDDAVIEVHITPHNVTKWVKLREDLQRILFNSADRLGFITGTMTGNGHLTRDIETGFEGDPLWFRNFAADHWNHPALADEIFDSESPNAVTLPRDDPKQRRHKLEWLGYFDDDYLYYLDSLERALDQPDLDPQEIRDALILRPSVARMRSNYASSLGVHDDALNLMHDNRLEYRGFVNQSSAIEWLNQIRFLENRNQRLRDVDGMIPVNMDVVNTQGKARPGSAVQEFINYGSGMNPNTLRSLLKKELRPQFDFFGRIFKPSLKIKHQGIRSREIALWQRLYERLIKAAEAERQSIASAGDTPHRDNVRRLVLLDQCINDFATIVPGRISTAIQEGWKNNSEQLKKLAGRFDTFMIELKLKNLHASPHSRSPAYHLAYRTDELLVQAYWEAIQKQDAWSKRLIRIVATQKRFESRPYEFLLLLLVRYSESLKQAPNIEDFQQWLLSQPNISIEEDSALLEMLPFLSKFLGANGGDKYNLPSKLMADSLKRGHTFSYSEAESILRTSFASREVKKAAWKVYRPSEFFDIIDFRNAVAKFGIDLKTLSSTQRALSLGNPEFPSELLEKTLAGESLESISNSTFSELEADKERLRQSPIANKERIDSIIGLQARLPNLSAQNLETLWYGDIRSLRDTNQGQFRKLIAEIKNPAQLPSEWIDFVLNDPQTPDLSELLGSKVGKTILDILEHGSLSADTRLSAYNTLFSFDQRAAGISYEFYLKLWKGLGPSEFLAQRGPWKKRIRRAVESAMETDDYFLRNQVLTRLATSETAFFKRSELLRHAYECTEALTAKYRETTGFRFSIDEGIYRSAFILNMLLSRLDIRNLSNRAWQAIGRAIGTTGVEFDLQARRLPKIFWRSLIEELNARLAEADEPSRYKENKRVATAGIALAHSLRRDPIEYPPELWEFIHEKFDEALSLHRKTGRLEGRAKSIAYDLVLFANEASRIPAAVRKVMDELLEIRGSLEREQAENKTTTVTATESIWPYYLGDGGHQGSPVLSHGVSCEKSLQKLH